MSALHEPPHERPESPHAFVRFHTRHKLLLMAHAPAAVSRLGRIVARAGTEDLTRVWPEYVVDFRAALAEPPSRGGHANALLHAVGYFRGVADEARRQQMVRAIELYASGATSLVAPVRLIREAAVAHGIRYLTDQVYLQPSTTFDER